MAPTLLLDLEQRLAADAAGWERDGVMERLREMRRGVRRELDKGVEPARYRELQALTAALDAALEIVPRLWRAVQPPSTQSAPS